jgi:nucleoside-diphosphate-sugar epimerase
VELDAYRGKRILITGGTGYLGTNLIQGLVHTPCTIIRLGRPTAAFVSVDGIACIEDVVGDIRDREIWPSLLEGVDYVFHLAAYEHKHGSEHDPVLDLEVNALSVLHLLEVCRQEKYFPKIVFVSSTNIVGLPSKIPIDETSVDNPLTVYAIHKLMAEKYLQYYAREFHLQSVTLRLSNVYGPAPDDESAAHVVLNRIIRKAVRGGPLTLYKNHSCVRDYVFVDDVTTAFLMAGISREAASGQYFVIGTGVGCRIMDAVNLIAERTALRTGRRPAVEVKPTEPLEAIEWRNSVADMSRFRVATGWSPRVFLIEGIDRTIDYFLNDREKAVR